MSEPDLGQPLAGALAAGVGMTGRGVRIAPLVPLPAVLAELGFDSAAVVGEAGFDLAMLEDPDREISYAASSKLLAHCVAVTRCEHLGLLLGARGGLATLGLPGLLMMTAPDVASALAAVIAFLRLHDRIGVPSLEIGDEFSVFGYQVVEAGGGVAAQVHDLAIAVACNLMRALCGNEWNPTEVLLPRRSPVDAAPWGRFFRAPVRFNAGRCGLVFASHWLRKPLPGSNDLVHRHLVRDATERLRAEPAADFIGEVRGAVRQTMAHGRCNAAGVAQWLGLNERTLDRRLQRLGTTFGEVRDAVLFAMSTQLLDDSAMNLTEIAAAIGYAEASSFIRAFVRWSGQTPTAWRRARARPAGPATPVHAAPPARRSRSRSP
jgi:AraC-like DNA-binding protein